MNKEEQEYEFLYKIVLIGDTGVGKTNLLERLAHNRFNPGTKSTIGVEFDTKCFTVDGKRIKAQIWDTAGQERYRAITSAYYRGAVGAIIVYDITRKDSFDNAVTQWVKQLRDNAEENIVISLVGNKTDLAGSRAVTLREAKEAAEHAHFQLTETSALSDVNVKEAFQGLVEQIFRRTPRAAGSLPVGGPRKAFDIEDEQSIKSGLWCC